MHLDPRRPLTSALYSTFPFFLRDDTPPSPGRLALEDGRYEWNLAHRWNFGLEEVGRPSLPAAPGA